MTPRLFCHFSIFGLVFFVLKSLLGIATQWSRELFAILTLKPRSHDVRIFIYRMRVIVIQRLRSCCSEMFVLNVWISSSFPRVLVYVLWNLILKINWRKTENWNLSKSVKTCDERSTFAISIPFLLNIYFHDFRVENYF